MFAQVPGETDAGDRRQTELWVSPVSELQTGVSINSRQRPMSIAKLFMLGDWTSAELVLRSWSSRSINWPVSIFLKPMKQYTSLLFFHITKRKKTHLT